MSYAILTIVKKLDGENVDLSSEPLLNWYWNQGEPYLGDIYKYYIKCKKIAMDNGADGYNLLKPIWRTVKSSKYIGNFAKWNTGMANTHKFLLLNRNHFWYQRHFLDIRYRRPYSLHFMDSEKPREIKTGNIQKETHEITVGN